MGLVGGGVRRGRREGGGDGAGGSERERRATLDHISPVCSACRRIAWTKALDTFFLCHSY